MEILITAGDHAGIGPEVILKSLCEIPLSKKTEFKALIEGVRSRQFKLCVLADQQHLHQLIRTKKLPLVISNGSDGLNACISHRDDQRISFALTDVPFLFEGPTLGKPSELSGSHAYRILELSMDLLTSAKADAVVTAPVSKEAIGKTKPDFIGHTEFYAQATGVKNYSMTFLSEVFNLVLMTTHVGIKDLAECITEEVVDTAIQAGLSIQRLTDDKGPLLVCGFNPHAGEGGMFGDEDKTITAVVERYTKAGVSIVGPYPADSGFVRVYHGDFKTVIACYHDQGLIPLKMLSQGHAVNFTMGLPFVRTSVDHGTAYDIAPKWEADWQSMAYAILQTTRLIGSSG